MIFAYSVKKPNQLQFNSKQQENNKISLWPELVVGVSHLMSSEFRHEDFNNSDEYEEVDLTKDNNAVLSMWY